MRSPFDKPFGLQSPFGPVTGINFGLYAANGVKPAIIAAFDRQVFAQAS